MTQKIYRIRDIASDYDVIVFDQWGVLHNGSTPYADAIDAIQSLAGMTDLAVLSNSGKRAGPNAARISGMGFHQSAFACVMTSGEALWRDVDRGVIAAQRFLPVERDTGDAAHWAEGLSVQMVERADEAQAVLLMGLPDGAGMTDWEDSLNAWLDQGLPVFCSNPDRQSPRADGLVISPGALAFRFREMGGDVHFYGKPHKPVFRALSETFGAGRYLMVGDSMEHDIAGAQGAGWHSLLVEGGLYAHRFNGQDDDGVVAEIAAEAGVTPPTYRIKELR